MGLLSSIYFLKERTEHICNLDEKRTGVGGSPPPPIFESAVVDEELVTNQPQFTTNTSFEETLLSSMNHVLTYLPT